MEDANMKAPKYLFSGSMFVALTLSVLMTGSVCVYPTPPISLELSYTQKTKILDVKVTHPTLFPSSHYIAFIDIKNRGRTVTSATYTSQPSKTSFTYSFPVNAGEGDIIEVTATCSFFGSKTSTLTILPSPIKTN
jgi:TusA-related sulfurtransferase